MNSLLGIIFLLTSLLSLFKLRYCGLISTWRAKVVKELIQSVKILMRLFFGLVKLVLMIMLTLLDLQSQKIL
uniref:Transmembrane protein n=1 Tax=Medicago truncatula TaxID=3880 RepID=I3SR25_MEDTR|nr:unknown [Medicago truncatula]